MYVNMTLGPVRRTQSDRRASTRSALLESAARGLSRVGYRGLLLERVASEAGYTRGALYHLFADKEDLALAVVEWVTDTWWAEVGPLADRESDPVAALVALARGHAIYCRREVAQVLMTLRVEFRGQDHPIGRAVDDTLEGLVTRCAQLITAGRRASRIPAGPPAVVVARAYVGAVEGLTAQLGGLAPHDTLLAERAVLGLLGLDASAAPSSTPLGARRAESREPRPSGA